MAFTQNTLNAAKMWQLALALCCALLLSACGLTDHGSLLDDDLEVGSLGCNAFVSEEEGELEVPPDLAQPDTSKRLIVPGTNDRVSASNMALKSYVLPTRLDMQIYREGSIAWLSVDTDPTALWPALQEFLEKNGFVIIESDPTQGYITTDWRQRKISTASDNNSFVSLRSQVYIRIERDPNAVSNIFFTIQTVEENSGNEKLILQDSHFEYRMLNYFKKFLASGREVANPRMPSIEDIKIELDIKNVAGIPVLAIGQHYSKVWRRIGVALAKSGMDIRSDDRSRGIYTVRVSNDDQEAQTVQIHLLSKDKGQTLLTVHPHQKGAKALSYEQAQRILKRVVLAYNPRNTST